METAGNLSKLWRDPMDTSSMFVARCLDGGLEKWRRGEREEERKRKRKRMRKRKKEEQVWPVRMRNRRWAAARQRSDQITHQ